MGNEHWVVVYPDGSWGATHRTKEEAECIRDIVAPSKDDHKVIQVCEKKTYLIDNALTYVSAAIKLFAGGDPVYRDTGEYALRQAKSCLEEALKEEK